MTQLEFPAASHLSPLAARILEWASEHGPARFWQLTDAMPESVSDVDAAACEAGVLHWVGGRISVERPGGAEGVET